jgi:hypothetical protein
MARMDLRTVFIWGQRAVTQSKRAIDITVQTLIGAATTATPFLAGSDRRHSGKTHEAPDYFIGRNAGDD